MPDLMGNRKWRKLGGFPLYVQNMLLVAITLLCACWSIDLHHIVGLPVFKEQFLALIFALQEVSPAAMFIFDEVDKDLDGVNTRILADAIQRRCEERQYLVISHHRTMLERSSQTLGVTMRKGFGTVVTGVSVEETGGSDEEVTILAQAAQQELAS